MRALSGQVLVILFHLKSQWCQIWRKGKSKVNNRKYRAKGRFKSRFVFSCETPTWSNLCSTTVQHLCPHGIHERGYLTFQQHLKNPFNCLWKSCSKTQLHIKPGFELPHNVSNHEEWVLLSSNLGSQWCLEYNRVQIKRWQYQRFSISDPQEPESANTAAADVDSRACWVRDEEISEATSCLIPEEPAGKTWLICTTDFQCGDMSLRARQTETRSTWLQAFTQLLLHRSSKCTVHAEFYFSNQCRSWALLCTWCRRYQDLIILNTWWSKIIFK